MRVIDHRQFRLTNKRRKLPKWAKLSLIGLGALAGVFVLGNIAMLVLYRGIVLPNYSVGSVPIGGARLDQLDKKVSVEHLLPAEVTFTKEHKTEALAPKDLGVAVDWVTTRETIKGTRSWLPLLSFVSKRVVPVELKLDNTTFATTAKKLETKFTKAALPERIAFQNDAFAIVPPEAGYTPDVVQLRLDLITRLEKGESKLEVPTTVTNSTEPMGQLEDELAELQKRLDAKITLLNGSQTKQLTRAQIAAFYESAGQTLKLSDTKMSEVVAAVASGFGITPVNQSEAVQASHYALNKQQPITFSLANQGTKVYHYCVALRNVDGSALSEYRQKLAAVYGDPQGWRKGGIALVYAESGCDYTAWLSAPGSMTSFGGLCDSYYSCRSGPNVVVNYDRWKGATDPWNAAGGSLEDYRVMVINHETGHWLGFAHRNCPGAGQPAPVMQQQSIDLQGCKFNPWPTAAEIASL